MPYGANLFGSLRVPVWCGSPRQHQFHSPVYQLPFYGFCIQWFDWYPTGKFHVKTNKAYFRPQYKIVVVQRREIVRCDPYHSISITPDLKVRPCSCSSGLTIGQITERTSLKDIWYGENMQNFRQNMYSHNPPVICKTCTKWDRRIGEWMNTYLRCLKVQM